MKTQPAAEGILKMNDWGDSKVYRVPCSCGDGECGHDTFIEIESDAYNIVVSIFVKTQTRFWDRKRWRDMWHLLTKGYIESYSDVHLTQQQAFNYATTLINSVHDLEEFRNKQNVKN